MKKILSVALVLLLCVAFGAFAKETKSSKFPWMVSYNQPGQFNLYASAGFYGFGLEVSAGPELMMGSFDIAGVPLEWGLTARGLIGFSSYFGYASWLDWGVAAMGTIHWGVDFGGPLKFDWYVGLGPSLSGSTGTYYGSSLMPWLANFDGVTWQFSDNFALIVEYTYTYYASIGGVGIKMNL